MGSKPKKEIIKSTSFRLDPVTLNQLDWLQEFCKQLSVPSITQRMVIARAIEFYTEHAEDLLITFYCKSRHSDVIAEQRALIDAGETRKSSFPEGILPESMADGGRLTGYRALARAALQTKKPKLPGLRMDKQTRATLDLNLKDRKQRKEATQATT